MNREEREAFNKISPRVGGVFMKDDDGNVRDVTGQVEGVTKDNQTVYQKADGTWTTDPLSYANFSLNTKTGDIELTAPKNIYELPEFQKVFDENAIKSYSAAYKSNPAYRVPYTQLNEDGTTSETQITIPEFVERLNDALGNFIDNYRVAEKNKKKLVEKYGEKANNLTLSQLSVIQSSGADANRIYLPDFIFDFDSDFLSLANKRDEDGSVSVEDFMKVYNRSKVDQNDLAEIMATIEGHLKGSDWGEDVITYDDGTVANNSNSATEAARALSLKNFILSKDPDSEWYQSIGDGLVTFVSNAAEGFTSVFMNTATFAEGLVTFGQSHVIENATEEMNEAFSKVNEERTLIQDSTATLATLGRIGGMIGGTVLENYLAGAAIEGVSAKYASKLAEGRAASEALLNIGPSAKAALTAESMESVLSSIKDISLGAKFALRVSSVAEKMTWAKNIYSTYKGLALTNKTAYEALNWTTSFLLDTVHDAIVYDAVTLRHVIEGSDDQNMKDYWLGQLADNAKWWIGTGFARTMFKYAGNTSIGEALNAKVTTKLADISVKIGDKKLAIKDSMYGGEYIRKLEDRIQGTKPGPARDRLVNQRNQELQNIMLRDARRQLAKMDLEFEGLRLTEKSAENYRNAMTEIKNIELVIDRYGQDLGFKRQEMVGLVSDPSVPGRKIFVNPDLGGANVVSGRIYDKLADLTKKYGLRDIDALGVSQDIVDYVVGTYDVNIKTAIFLAGGNDATKAGADAEVISANLAALKNKLPEELISELDNSGAIKAYTDFQFALNDYAKSKGLVDIDTINSYQDNPIWKENGYMPIWKADDRTGHWVSNDGTYQALIQRDIEHFEYNTKPGQHYVNPELVRQYRINDVAKEEVNQELKNAFTRLEDATNKIIVTGEESERAKNYQIYNKTLKQAIDKAWNGLDDNLLILPRKITDKDIKSNAFIDIANRSEVISSLSLDDTTKILQDKHILNGGNKRIANLVTEENYADFFNDSSQPVKNYLLGYYSENFGADEEILEDSIGTMMGRRIREFSGESPNLKVTHYTADELQNGNVPIAIRRQLAEKALENDPSEGANSRVVVWKLSGDEASDVDNLADLNLLDDDGLWAGGEVLTGSSAGYSPSYKARALEDSDMMSTMKRADILPYGEFIDISKTATDIRALRSGLGERIGVDEAALKNKSIYEKLNGLDDATLEKVMDGDPREILKLSGKKAVEMNDGRLSKYVVFPDITPGVYKEGFKAMAKAGNPKVKQFNGYDIADLKRGKYSAKSRLELAYNAESKALDDSAGKDVYRTYYRVQNDGKIDGFHDTTYSGFQTPEGVGLDGAYRIREGNYWSDLNVYGKNGSNALVFIANDNDVLNSAEAGQYKLAASVLSDMKKADRLSAKTPTSEQFSLIQEEVFDKLKKSDNATLRKIADGDPRALLDLTDKKIIDAVDKDGNRLGEFIFPERNPEVLEDSFKRMSQAEDISIPENRNRHLKRLESLTMSKENLEFLNNIGWDKPIGAYKSKTSYAQHRTRYGQDSIRANLDSIDTLAKLYSAEIHELAHAAWSRASMSTRKKIGEDLLRILGIDNISVDNTAACSRDLNELIAHAIETRFQGKKGWDLLKNDEFMQKHLANLAAHSYTALTPSFKNRVITVIRSLVTFIKTKVFGINDAKTFDEFYYGLTRGDFADDLRRSIETDAYTNTGKLSKSKLVLNTMDSPNKSNFKVNVEGPKSVGKNVNVDITKTIPVEDLSEGAADIPVEVAGKSREIPVKYTKSGGEIIPDFYPNAENSYELFRKSVQDGGDDFEAGLQRAYLLGNENFAKSPELNRALDNLEAGKSAFFEGYAVEKAKAHLQGIKNIDTDDLVNDLRININVAVNNYMATIMDNPSAKRAIEAIAGDSNNGAALAGKYISLQRLIKNDEAKCTFIEEVRKSLLHKGISMDNSEKILEQAESLWTDYIRSELNDAMNALRTTNNMLVDSNNIYEEVQALANKIDEAKKSIKGGNAIMYLDSKGRQVYAEVDPNYASLYNLRYEMSDTEASAFAKVNAAMSKLFRYGTTTLNLSSFSNQLFRDTGNALIVGGAWETIKKNANNLVEVFGDDIVEQIKRFDPSGYEMRQVEALAKESGQTIQQAAVSRELARGAAVSPATTETTLYRDVLRKARGKSSSIDLVNAANEKLRGAVDVFNKVDDLMNGKREIYLRNRVYANNLSRALSQGYNLEQARAYANFAMNNATTNFTRQLYHMQAIADSTPYFKAAINGTKSFWRMWSLDPVGISGRMMGGLILPTIFLTGASLGDPDNREVYKNLPEYQKDENLIFVVDKQVISIPIPQEIANIVSPFRQFTEYLYNSNENDFWELMMNDVLGFSPVDMQGFSTIDMDKLSHDPNIGDRISRGFSRVFSQVAPVPVKSAYMMVTGTDPYTGKNLYDPSYAYWDDATDSLQTMDYNQNLFAKWVAKMWGKDSNAAVLEKVTSGIVGSTGSNLLGELVALVEKGPGAAAETLAADAITQATNPYTVQVYDQIDSIWKRAVRTLTAEKDLITNSKEFKTIYSELSQTKDEEKRKKLIASGQDLVKEYQNKVVEIVKRLESVYQGTFDRKKFGAVIQLLNFNTDPVYQSGTQYSSDIASDAYYEGRDMAIATMQALGVTGSKDMSIFGYLTTDDDGNSVMKYSSPVAIMDMKSTWMGAKDIDQANIAAKLKTDGIKTTDMWDGFYKAKAQGSAALKAYKAAWNAKVMKSLAPYISERGIESVLKNNKTVELIDDYLLIDNKYQTKAYLKKIFENVQ